MIKVGFTALTITSLLTACGQKKEEPVLVIAPANFGANVEARPTSQPSPAIPPKKEEVAQEFPQPFDLKDGQSLREYEGIDAFKFLTMYKSKLEITKGEFESTAEFSKRKSDVETLLNPISAKAGYAFRLKNFKAKYDADTNTYSSNFSCDVPEKSATMRCLVGISSDADVSYMAQNGYGAKVDVNRKVAYFLNLAIKDKSPLFKKNSRMSPELRLIDLKVPVPVEKARSLRLDSLSLLLVGQVESTGIINDSLYQAPTRENPTEFIYKIVAIPFALKKAIFYDSTTGEVLMERAF